MDKNNPQLNTPSPYIEPMNDTVEEAKLMQSIETNDKLETLNKTSEAVLLEQTKSTEAVKELSPAMEALVKLNAELLEVIREHQKIDLTAFSKVKTISLQGEKGDKGDKGEVGDKGEKGDRGEKGDTGPRGEKGETGKTGPRGEMGPMGVQGIQGEKGEKGERGDNGKNGKNGSPDSAEDIAKKLNSLEKVLDFKIIKNFPDRFPGNWGPSSPTSESTGNRVNFETPSGDIDGVNTTFTVLNTPKCVFLNGVTYFENDGYTLSGLDITFIAPIVPSTGSTLRSMY